MIRTAFIFEIEETLFDTIEVRATALGEALMAEGVSVLRADVVKAHRGQTARMALAALPITATLDDTGADLVLKRAADIARDGFERAAPAFDVAARDAVLALAADFPVGVVTRGDRQQAQAWLEQASLDTCVGCVRSLGDLALREHIQVWNDVRSRLHAARGAMFAPAPLFAGARSGEFRDIAARGLHEDVALSAGIALHELDAALICSLFEMDRGAP